MHVIDHIYTLVKEEPLVLRQLVGPSLIIRMDKQTPANLIICLRTEHIHLRSMQAEDGHHRE